MGITALYSLDYYKGKLNAEYCSLLRSIDGIRDTLMFAEESLALSSNELCSDEFERLASEFINKVRAIKERVNNFDEDTRIPNQLTVDNNIGHIDGRQDARSQYEDNPYDAIVGCEPDEYSNGYANAYAFNKAMNDHRSEFVDGVIPYDKFYPWFKDELDKVNAYIAEKRSIWDAYQASKREGNEAH